MSILTEMLADIRPPDVHMYVAVIGISQEYHLQRCADLAASGFSFQPTASGASFGFIVDRWTSSDGESRQALIEAGYNMMQKKLQSSRQ